MLLPLALLALPAGAAAQGPTTQTFELAVSAGRIDAVTAGRTWQVHGKLTPIVLGQRAVVTFKRRSVLLEERTVDVDPITGGFTVDFATRKGGLVTVKAVTIETPTEPVVQSNEVKVTVLGKVDGKRKGGSVRELQRLLKRKGYVVGQWGVYDERTARAVMAFRKVTGMRRTFTVDKSVLRALAHGRGRYRVRFPKHGRHIEADISRQVMVLASGRRVLRIYHISSGAPGTPTVRGLVPRLPQVAWDQRQGDGPLLLLHPRLRDPRLRLGSPVQRIARVPARTGARRAFDLQLGTSGHPGRHLPLVPWRPLAKRVERPLAKRARNPKPKPKTIRPIIAGIERRAQTLSEPEAMEENGDSRMSLASSIASRTSPWACSRARSSS